MVSDSRIARCSSSSLASRIRRTSRGRRIIQEIYQWTRASPQFNGRVVFLEDYDAHVGRRMYQGVDLWLNNPLRPLEASGTSGMKLPPSGGLNL